MKVKQFIIEVLKQTRRKILMPKYIITGALIVFVYWAIFDYKDISIFQSDRIHTFQKDYAETNKPLKDIQNEGFVMIGAAKSPRDCWDATEAIYLLTRKEADKESDMTRLEIIQASNDILWEQCK